VRRSATAAAVRPVTTPRTRRAGDLRDFRDLDHATKSRQLAGYLARFTALVVSADDVGEPLLGLDNRVADEIVSDELRALVLEARVLQRRVEQLNRPLSEAAQSSARRRVERSLGAALRARPQVVDVMWPLLGPELPWATPDAAGSGSGHRDFRLGRHVAGLLLTTVIAAVIVVAVWAGTRRIGPLTALQLAAIWTLSFIPGWLYIRFIGQRAGALWDEYVLNLHRLGLDRPEHLPRPSVNSVFFTAWFDGGGATVSRHRNIYKQKFDAYYGRGVSEATADSRVRTGTIFPVVLATVVFAIGWTALFWDGSFVTGAPASMVDMLLYGFLGAYLFNIQMLSRRFFQSDLKPSAYASAVLRVVIVLILVAVLHQLPVFDADSGPQEAIVAFVVGLFPLVGLQALNRVASVVLRSAVPSLRSTYPLSDLDGLNVWYEARLLEEGIEDMQNLVSANTVEVLLHTRVPVGRLVDWYDQAQLYLHLSPRRSGWWTRHRDEKEGRVHPRAALASFGVRSATSFLKAFPPATLDQVGEPADPLVKRSYEAVAAQADGLHKDAILTIARVLDDEPGLNRVRNWRAWEAATRPAPDAADPDVATPERSLQVVESQRRPAESTSAGR
jgi:hypothetical protein